MSPSPACFDLLDAHVVGGRAEAEAVRWAGGTWSYARLLEEVAAFGGVLRHCGVTPGDQVGITVEPGVRQVVAVLAVSRIGARHTFEAAGEVVVGEAVRVAGEDHDWDVLIRAGRTDPAPHADGAVVTPYDERTRALLAPLLGGGTVELG